MCNKLTMIYVTDNNYVMNDNKIKWLKAQGIGQRFKAEAEAQKPHVRKGCF